MSTIRTPRRRRVAALTSIFVLISAAAGCNPVFGKTSGSVQHFTLTSPDGSDYAYQGETMAVTASLSAGAREGNIREVFWDTDTPFYADQQACITWDTLAFSKPGGLLQPGLAMRIAPTGPQDEHLRAITVTQNIWYAGVWKFNVHIWDTEADPAHPYTQIASHDLSDVVGVFGNLPEGGWYSTLIDPPWHVCARTLGDTFTLKVWTHQDPEPGWDDPTHVFHTTLPEGWDHAGYSGGYIGHLSQGRTATFSGFTTTPLCLAPDLIDTPRCQALLATAE